MDLPMSSLDLNVERISWTSFFIVSGFLSSKYVVADKVDALVSAPPKTNTAALFIISSFTIPRTH